MPINHIQSLPYLHQNLRQKGEIKTTAQDFIVSEIPLYKPVGHGDHLYISLTRQEESTTQVLENLSKLLNIRSRDIGCAGRKDKWATTTQTFSINLPHDNEDDLIKKIKDALPYKINSYGRHINKLRMGHLLGNRFIINVHTGALLDDILPIKKTILKYGLPNFFGEQRFGFHEKNINKGKALLNGEYRERKRNLRDLLHSAYQSYIFNLWLKTRIENGDYQNILAGDLAKGTQRGGLFTVEEPTIEQQRFENREICYTGALPGYKIPPTQGKPAEIETQIFIQEGIDSELFKKARLPGSRRMGIIWLNALDITQHPQGLSFQFSLPKGSYATNLLREFFIT